MAKRARGKRTKNWLFSIITTALFIGVGVLLILQHEPIESETLSPLVRLFGFSYQTSSFICLACVSLAVFLILSFAKFTKWQKILIVLSGGFLYFPSAYASFGIPDFFWGAKMDYLEFSKQLNESLFGVLIPIFELGLVFLLVYLAARHLKLFFAASIVFGAYLALLYFAAPAPLFSSETVPLLALMVLFIALTFVAKPRQRNRFDQIFGRLETYKFIKSRTSIRTLCLVPVFLSVPFTICSAINDLNSPVSDAYVVSGRFNEFEEDAVFISVSPDMTALFSLYTPLFSANRQFVDITFNSDDTSKNDAQLAETIIGLPSNNIYIMLRENACGFSIEPLSIYSDWQKIDFTLDDFPDMQMYKVKK